MKEQHFLSKPAIYFILIFILSSFVIPLKSQTVYPDYRDGLIYLKLKDTCTLQLAPYSYSNILMNQVFSDYAVNVPVIEQPFPDPILSIALSKVYRLSFADSSLIDSLIAGLQAIDLVDYAEKIPLVYTSLVPNDVSPLQYHLTKVNAIQAWDISQGSSAIVIAIVDNAVKITHTDLNANIWVNPGEIAGNFLDDDLNGYTDDINGYDVADDDNDPNPPPITDSDPFIHGTHCAGISSAVTDNSNGIASLGFNTSIMAVKCTPNTGNGNSLTNAYDGVYYAIQADADVISMSWGGPAGSITNESMINLANSLGIILVAAAGNDDTTAIVYPAAYNNVIGVGSTDQSDMKSGFSNYGSYIDVMAPGSGIYSTLAGTDNSYGSLSGTSMACPLTAALGALVLSAHPNFTPAQVEQAIENGCDNIDLINPSYVGQIGAGRINAFKTLSLVGIEGLLDESIGVDIYPNPSDGMVTISLKKQINTNDGILNIYDLSGKLVKSQKIMMQDSFTIDISVLPVGEYILKGVVDKNYFVKTIVKK